MTEHDTLAFLLSLATLLAVARGCGELARRLGMPLVFGELASGVFLGPTVLGRIAPGAQQWLFAGPTPQKMLGGYTTVAVVLLLVVAGLEVDLGVVRRRGRSALLTSVLGVALPMIGGVALGFSLPDSDLVRPDRRLLFALFLGVALSISALPVIAKTLLDLGLFKTDIGLLVMGAAMVDDVVGWLCFSLLLGPMRGGRVDGASVARTLGLTLGFVLFMFVVARPALDRLFSRVEKDHHTAPRRVLSLLVLLALFGASVTEAIGIHAVFGGFVVGVAAGDSPHLKERTRVVMHQFVTNIFAPVFFASIGLRVDFAKAFDLRLCALVFCIATIAKLVGCTLGARAGGLAMRPAAAVGFGLNARGAMEIILALIALDAGLIQERIFVALVVMALATSLVSGPMMKFLLHTPEEEDLGKLLAEGAFVPRLDGANAAQAIEELVGSLAGKLEALTPRARNAVLDREAVSPTGVGDRVAIPHAVVEGLERPCLALGLSPEGVDFDAADGLPANVVFLLLVPPRAHEREVRLLAAIVRVVVTEEGRKGLLATTTSDEAVAFVRKRLERAATERRTRLAAAAR